MKNGAAEMLTGCGVEYHKAKRRQKGYREALLAELPQLKMHRGAIHCVPSCQQ